MAFRSMVPFGGRNRPVGRRTEAYDPFESLRHEMDRLFEDFSGHRSLPAALRGNLPVPLDVRETDEAFVIAAELPGLEQKDIDITVANDVLTLKGEKQSEREETSDKVHFSERSYGSFARSLALPAGIDEDRISARFADGVLTVTLPKAPETQHAVKKIDFASS